MYALNIRKAKTRTRSSERLQQHEENYTKVCFCIFLQDHSYKRHSCNVDTACNEVQRQACAVVI